MATKGDEHIPPHKSLTRNIIDAVNLADQEKAQPSTSPLSGSVVFLELA